MTTDELKAIKIRSSRDRELAPNYEIRWQSRITGKEGGGKARFFQADAADIVRQADRRWPDLTHYMFVT